MSIFFNDRHISYDKITKIKFYSMQIVYKVKPKLFCQILK